MEPSLDTSVTHAASKDGRFGQFLITGLLHLAVIYLLANFGVVWLAAQVHNVLLPALQMPSSDSRFGFAFNHLVFFSIVCGLVSGGIAASYRHRAAQFVWIVPAVIFVYKFVTLPSTLFENHFAVAFHHYLAAGFLIPEFHSYQEMFANWSSDYVRGTDQVQIAAPVYVGIAYGFASWAGAHLGIRLPLIGMSTSAHQSPAGDKERSA